MNEVQYQVFFENAMHELKQRNFVLPCPKYDQKKLVEEIDSLKSPYDNRNMVTIMGRDRMNLLPQEIARYLPTPNDIQDEESPMVWIRLFHPMLNIYVDVIAAEVVEVQAGVYTYQLTARCEINGDSEVGLVCLYQLEFGDPMYSFSPMHPIQYERDLYFKPRRLKD